MIYVTSFHSQPTVNQHHMPGELWGGREGPSTSSTWNSPPVAEHVPHGRGSGITAVTQPQVRAWDRSEGLGAEGRGGQAVLGTFGLRYMAVPWQLCRVVHHTTLSNAAQQWCGSKEGAQTQLKQAPGCPAPRASCKTQDQEAEAVPWASPSCCTNQAHISPLTA